MVDYNDFGMTRKHAYDPKVLPPALTPNPPITLVIAVLSARRHAHRRQVIRQSWASIVSSFGGKVIVRFVVGAWECPDVEKTAWGCRWKAPPGAIVDTDLIATHGIVDVSNAGAASSDSDDVIGLRIADSQAEFGDEQGRHGWWYGYYKTAECCNFQR